MGLEEPRFGGEIGPRAFETNSQYFDRKLREGTFKDDFEKFLNADRLPGSMPFDLHRGLPPPPTSEQWERIYERTRELSDERIKEIFRESKESTIKRVGEGRCPHLSKRETTVLLIIPWEELYCKKMEEAFSNLGDCEKNSVSPRTFLSDFLNPYFPSFSESILIDRMKELGLLGQWKCGNIRFY